MSKSILCVMFSPVLVAGSSPAYAGHWLLIGAEGDHAPDRTVFYADLNYLVTRRPLTILRPSLNSS